MNNEKIINYCLDCNLYKDNWEGKPRKKGFCQAGYTQNPLTLSATINVLKNKGLVCERNPFRKEAYVVLLKPTGTKRECIEDGKEVK